MTFNIKAPNLKAMFSGKAADQAPAKLFIDLPGEAIEEAHSSYGILRGITSKHTRELRYIFGIICLTVLVIMTWLAFVAGMFIFDEDGFRFGVSDNFEQIFLTRFLPAAFSVIIGAFLTLFQFGKKRFATVDLFSMEILSIVRLIAISDIVGLSSKYVHAVGDEGSPERSQVILDRLSASLSIYGDDTFAGIFLNNTSELGWLDAGIVDHTTGFYTFIRSLHNVANSMKEFIDNSEETPSKESMVKYLEDINYIIDTAMDNAYRAFGGLIQISRHREVAQHAALYVGCRANNFLMFDLYGENHPKYQTTFRRHLFYERELKRHKHC